MVLVRVAPRITPYPHTRNSTRLYSVFIPEAETTWFSIPFRQTNSSWNGDDLGVSEPIRLATWQGCTNPFCGALHVVVVLRQFVSSMLVGSGRCRNGGTEKERPKGFAATKPRSFALDLPLPSIHMASAGLYTFPNKDLGRGHRRIGPSFGVCDFNRGGFLQRRSRG